MNKKMLTLASMVLMCAMLVQVVPVSAQWEIGSSDEWYENGSGAYWYWPYGDCSAYYYYENGWVQVSGYGGGYLYAYLTSVAINATCDATYGLYVQVKWDSYYSGESIGDYVNKHHLLCQLYVNGELEGGNRFAVYDPYGGDAYHIFDYSDITPERDDTLWITIALYIDVGQKVPPYNSGYASIWAMFEEVVYLTP